MVKILKLKNMISRCRRLLINTILFDNFPCKQKILWMRCSLSLTIKSLNLREVGLGEEKRRGEGGTLLSQLQVSHTVFVGNIYLSYILCIIIEYRNVWQMQWHLYIIVVLKVLSKDCLMRTKCPKEGVGS
jgi:hypothetical protein